MRTILHPTDFSERSSYALQLAITLAKSDGAKLIVLHVEAPKVIYDEMGGVECPLDEREQEAALAKLQSLSTPGVSVTHRLQVGDAAATILDVATETGCDLIVMGTHGRTGLSRLLLGSVAEEVVRKAPCPVLTAKVPFPPYSPTEKKENGKRRKEQIQTT